jgi:hypothetical protein
MYISTNDGTSTICHLPPRSLFLNMSAMIIGGTVCDAADAKPEKNLAAENDEYDVAADSQPAQGINKIVLKIRAEFVSVDST